jgi:hypothetical protein
MEVIKRVFSYINYILYIWHIDCNIMKKILSLIKEEFEDSDISKFVEFVDKEWKNFKKD